MASLGNTGASALLRSSSSIATAQTDYQDKLAALKWANSAHTDADWQEYSSYLNGRVDKLQGTGTLTNASKALSITSTLQTAQKAYVSSTIQRSSIDVLEGNGTLQDKANAVASFYSMATQNGDDGLAQSLRSQFDSIDQQMQYQAQTAATASETLSKANSSATAAGYSTAAHALESGLQNLTNEYKQGGQAAFTKALTAFTTAHADTLKALGVTIPKGAAPNLGQVTQGIIQAIGQYNVLASQATAATDPTQSANFMATANDIVSGTKTFASPIGSVSYDQAGQWAANPNMFIENQTIGKNGLPQYGLTQSTVSGYQFDSNGKLTSVPTGTTTQPYDNLSKDQQKQIQDRLTKLGFTTKISNGQITVQLTDKTAQWIDPNKINANKNEQFTVIPTANGLQFTNTDANGNAHLYNLASDARNLSAIYEVSHLGNTLVHGQYGFNPNVNTMINGAQVKQAQQTALQTSQNNAVNSLLTLKSAPLNTAPAPGTIGGIIQPPPPTITPGIIGASINAPTPVIRPGVIGGGLFGPSGAPTNSPSIPKIGL